MQEEIIAKNANFCFPFYLIAKVWRMKRGRGRPRKNSLNSNLSNTQNSYLEEGENILYGICFSIILILHQH